MADRTANRRNLAASLDPLKSSDPTTRNRLKTTAPTTNTTATVYNHTNHLSKLYTSDRTSRAKKPHVDTLLQAKALAKSAVLDSSKNGPFLEQGPKTVKFAKERRRVGLEKDKKSLVVVVKESEKEKSRDDGKVMIAKEKVERRSKIGEEKRDDGSDVVRPKVALTLTDGGGGGFYGGGGGGRRRSFGDIQIELADFFVTNGVKVVSADMPPFMQIHAVSCARKTRDSLEKFTSKALAFSLKKEFDGVYGPAWHCIVGTSFGSFVTHSVGGFLYFSMDQKLHILLFKTTVQRVD
ncbi:hypothetical protein Ancab_038972 [Ancistrocladus abbreviatus]